MQLNQTSETNFIGYEYPLKNHESYNASWRFINKDGLEQMKEFQQRNKMAMQYLLIDKERKAIKTQFREEWQDKLLAT